MTIRQTIAKIIADDNGDADDKALTVLTYLHAIGSFSPENGRADDDPEMGFLRRGQLAPGIHYSQTTPRPSAPVDNQDKEGAMDIIDKLIGEDDDSFSYFLKRAFCIGVVLNPLLWIAVIAIIVAAIR